jgi:predicted DNA-binding WGR domain protein
MSILESIDLFFQQGSSDKEYHLQLVKPDAQSLYEVNTQWGRRGSALQAGTKGPYHTRAEAQKVYNKIKGEKLGKGYATMDGHSPTPDVTPQNQTTPREEMAMEAAVTVLPRSRKILWEPDPGQVLPPRPWTPGPNAMPAPLHGGALTRAQQGPDSWPVLNTGFQTQNFPQLLNMIDDEAEVERLLDDDDWGMQEKMDGTHKMVQWGRGGNGSPYEHGLWVTNKKGKVITPSPTFVEGLQYVLNPYSGEKSHMLLDGEQIGDKFYVFDILEYANADFRSFPYAVRYLRLEEEFKPDHDHRVNIIRVPLYTGEEKRAMYDRFKAEGKEGVVFKKLNATFTAGKSHRDMVKHKFYATCSCRVSNRATGKQSVGLELLDANGTWVDVGNVTTIGHATPNPHSTIEVRYLYFFRGGCLFQPTYIGPRDDVDQEECLMTQLKYKTEN